MRLSLPFVTLLFFLPSLSAFSLDSMQPGLWEIDTTYKSKTGNFEKMMTGLQAQVLKNMTPEERKIYQDSMAEEGTIMNGSNSIIKSCITKEQASKMEVPKFQKGCTQQVLKQSSSYLKLKFKCTGQFPASGEGDFKLDGPKAYVATANIDLIMAGKPEKLNATSKGKWLSDNCGNIKPEK